MEYILYEAAQKVFGFENLCQNGSRLRCDLLQTQVVILKHLFFFPVHKQEIKIEILKGKSGSKSRSKKVMQQQPKKPDSSHKHFTCNYNTYIHIFVYLYIFVYVFKF